MSSWGTRRSWVTTPGDVRAAEPEEGLPLSVRLSVGRLLDEAGLEDVRRDEGLYVALWRGGADAWRREQAVRPLTPQALGSYALLVAMHPEGAEVVFRADRLLLTGNGAVLVPTSSSYRLGSRGGDLKLLVVVRTRLDESAAPRGSEHAVPVGGDEETGRDGDEVGQEQPTGEEQQQDQPEVRGGGGRAGHCGGSPGEVHGCGGPAADDGGTGRGGPTQEE